LPIYFVTDIHLEICSNFSVRVCISNRDCEHSTLQSQMKIGFPMSALS